VIIRVDVHPPATCTCWTGAPPSRLSVTIATLNECGVMSLSMLAALRYHLTSFYSATPDRCFSGATTWYAASSPRPNLRTWQKTGWSGSSAWPLWRNQSRTTWYYTWLPRFKQWSQTHFQVRFRRKRTSRPDLHQLAQRSADLPRFVQVSAVAMRYLRLLGPLDWTRFPERDLDTPWTIPPLPFAPFVAACLVKLNEQHVYMPQLRDYLVEHPALTWVLGFPLVPSRHYPWGFDAQASLPTARHLTRMLRQIPNAICQYLLDETVRLLQAELNTEVDDFGQAISLDTKHIIAWVCENNPKDYVKDRYDKSKQPSGDPDCRLGCKRRRSQRTSSTEPPPTPPDNPVPGNTVRVAEYYWGYASGVVATKVPGWGEFVLAELTQPFNQPDVSYFHPLMADTERRLGFRPRYGAFDAAFDAFYVYEHFHRDDLPLDEAFAAVPLSKRGGKRR